MSEWRVGRKLGVTLYRDEVFVGHVCSATVAAEIVETMNRVGRLLDEVRAETAREHSPAAADCPECNRRIWLADGRLIPHPPDDDPQSSLCPASLRTPDAQRRSEATPKNDLEEDPYALACLCIGTHHGNCPVLRPFDPSRVDPYDTTKGGVTDG